MPAPPRHLLALPGLAATAKLVLVVLYDRADADALAAHLRGEGPPPFVWPGWQSISADLDLGRSAVLDALKALRDRGQIRRADGQGSTGERVTGWELTPSAAPVREAGPEPPARTESADPDPVRGPGLSPPPRTESAGPDPQVPPSHTLPSPNPSEPTIVRETAGAPARKDMAHETPSEAPSGPRRSRRTVRPVRLVQLPGNSAQPSTPPAAHVPEGPPTPEAPPGLVAAPKRRPGRKPPATPPPEDPAVAAALDALHAARLRIDQTNRKARSPMLAGDQAKLERPLIALDLLTDEGKPDFGWWKKVADRFAEEVRREAARTGKRPRDVHGGKFLELGSLSVPGNFRRYYERDYLDQILDLDAGAPSDSGGGRSRAAPPGRMAYRPGVFAAGESDME